MTISVVIVACNEERTLDKVLVAAKQVADEIILVDSGSTDNTVAIAETHGVRVIHQAWLGYSDQKNFAITFARCSWILSLDADEILSTALIGEIKQILSDHNASEMSGFWIPRLFHIGESPIRFGGFSPDPKLRLFQQDKGKFNGRLVHEALTVSGPTLHLRNSIIHLAYADWDHYGSTLDKYAWLSSQEHLKKGFGRFATSKLNLYLHPVWTFFYKYFLRFGILDGYIGLRANLLYAKYIHRKIQYLRSSRYRVEDKTEQG